MPKLGKSSHKRSVRNRIESVFKNLNGMSSLLSLSSPLDRILGLFSEILTLSPNLKKEGWYWHWQKQVLRILLTFWIIWISLIWTILVITSPFVINKKMQNTFFSKTDIVLVNEASLRSQKELGMRLLRILKLLYKDVANKLFISHSYNATEGKISGDVFSLKDDRVPSLDRWSLCFPKMSGML